MNIIKDVSSKKDFDIMVEAAIKGDRDALTNLCNNISRDVLYLSTFFLGKQEGAEDIAQEAMYDVCRYINSLKKPKAFRSWLSAIIVNRKNNYLRDQIKRGTTVEICEYVEERLIEERNDFVPVASLENTELRHVVKSLISELPDRQREIIALRYYEELKITEIAKIMGISFQCVSQQLAIANKKIKHGVDDYMHSSGDSKTTSRVSMGLIISSTLQHDAMAFGATHHSTVHSLATNCYELINSDALTVVANTTKQFTMLMTAITSAVCIATVFFVVSSLLQSSYVEPVQDLPMPEPAVIVFQGGTAVEDGLAHLNPESVSVITDDMDILRWWVTAANCDEVLLNGDGYDSTKTLSQLRESGNNGEFFIYFNLIDKFGRVHRQGVNFYLIDSLY